MQLYIYVECRNPFCFLFLFSFHSLFVFDGSVRKILHFQGSMINWTISYGTQPRCDDGDINVLVLTFLFCYCCCCCYCCWCCCFQSFHLSIFSHFFFFARTAYLQTKTITEQRTIHYMYHIAGTFFFILFENIVLYAFFFSLMLSSNPLSIDLQSVEHSLKLHGSPNLQLIHDSEQSYMVFFCSSCMPLYYRLQLHIFTLTAHIRYIKLMIKGIPLNTLTYIYYLALYTVQPNHIQLRSLVARCYLLCYS